MKKTLSLIFVMIAIQSFSQLSITIDNKYGFKMLGSYDHYGYYGNISNNGSSSTISSKKYCFGNGYQGGLGLRYAFKSGFGIDLGVGYLLNTKSKTTYEYNSGGSNPFINDNSDEVKARMARINLGGSFCGTGKISPIIKMGVIFGMGKVIISSMSKQTSTQYSYNPNPPYNSYTISVTNTDEMEAKYYGGVSLGFSSAIGLNFNLDENVSVTLCLDLVVQEFAPKKGTLTKSIYNGVDQLPQMMKSEKEIEFVKEYTDVGGPPNNVSAGRSSKMSFPLSSFGPSFTIIYTIGKKKGAAKNVPKETTNTESPQ